MDSTVVDFKMGKSVLSVPNIKQQFLRTAHLMHGVNALSQLLQ